MRVGEVGGETKTSSRSGRFACRRSLVPKFLTWQTLLITMFGHQMTPSKPIELTNMAGKSTLR